MTDLPIVHMTLYKHGVGYFRRRGAVEGESITLTFRREEMDDLLKSLTIIDYGAGQIRGVDYDTPQSQSERLAGNSVILDDRRSMRDLLMALRGRQVQLQISDGSTAEGTLLGLDEDNSKPLEQSLVSVLKAETDAVVVLPINRLEGVTVQDETAAGDLRFFLQTALGQETHRSITVRLTDDPHDLEVSYIAPAPTWRVSYRFVADTTEDSEADSTALLQGWGIFDNRLEEDLNNISLSLTAGMPISFRYDLYTPHTPTRPLVEQEDRTAAAPVMFDAMMMEEAEEVMAGGMAPPMPKQSEPTFLRRRIRAERSFSAADLEGSTESAATGEAMGELFQYNVSVPVTVGRGKSAMVPIVSNTLGFKKDLIYNGRKMAVHPVATIRFQNKTGLTLEQGPVTVLENGEYVGEAVLPFTADTAEAVMSYAVELGVHVKEMIKNETKLESLTIKNGYFLRNVYEVRQTTYQLDNRTGQAKDILLEHNLGGTYKIFETPDPTEKTLDTHRYAVTATPRHLTEFVVKERYLHSRREELRNLSYRNLQNYFQNKYLDQKTYASLESLLRGWADISALNEQINAQEQQRAQIYKAQEQAQKNMKVLSKDGEEGRLRGRYVKQLTESEEELATIERTVQQLRAEIKQKEEIQQQMMQKLEQK
ncbi:MAG: hypothetical protein AAF485_13250 [Chloroflexota bacterium]